MTDALLAVDTEARTIAGLVLPFDELSRPSIDGTEPVMFTTGTVALPEDPSVVTLYDNDHDRHSPRGRATTLEATERGIVATFSVARTPEGDALLDRAQQTPRPRLSAELGDLIRSGARAVSSRLTGVSIASEGAFASAGLFALAPDIEGDERPATEDEVAEVATPETPAEETPEADQQKEEDDMTDVATLPEGVNPAGKEIEVDRSASGLFAAIQKVSRGDTAEAGRINQQNAMFAIAGIQHSGPSGATISADTAETGYLGELWAGNAYERRYVPLFNQRALTNFTVSGWRWLTAPVVGSYAGNLAEVPSNVVDTEPVTATALRIAGGHRLDRRFLDFNDQGVIESYFRKMSESYAKVSDAAALAAAVTAAGAASNITPVSGVNATLVGIIQGALGLVANNVTPTFAVVDPSIYASLLFEVDDDKLVNLGYKFGLRGGEFDGFTIVPGAVGTDNVLVGAKEAMTFFELPGVPIRVDALAVHNGALDAALYGYYATITEHSAGLVLKHTTP